MGSEWQPLTLHDVGVELIDCVHKTPADAGEGFAYIGIPQMNEGRIDFDANPRRITEADFLEWTKKANPQEDDVVLSRRCNPGETAIVKKGEQFALGQNLVLLRSESPKIFPPFLRWLTSGPEWWAQVGKFLNVGAVFDSLRCGDIPNFELSVPPLPDQKAIAHILGTLDDKIELNRRMNETLESMARALFKSWFVDFDPVIDNALAAGNPPTVQELIDECVLRIGDGYRAKRTELSESGLPFVRAGNLQDGGFDFSDAELLCEESCIKAGEKNSQPYDVAFTSKGTVGRMTMVTPKTQPFVYSPQVCWWRVVDQSKLDPHVLYRWMESSEFMHQVAKVKGNTDMADYVSLRDQRAMHVNLPSIEYQVGLAKELNSIDHKMADNREQSGTLTKLRDTLLPKLLSGELRIPDAKKLVAGSL